MSALSIRSCCSLFGGTKAPGETTYTVDSGFGVVVACNVPATLYSQCGEAWIDPQTAERLENILEEAYRDHHQGQIVLVE